jgi:hypothetical protein
MTNNLLRWPRPARLVALGMAVALAGLASCISPERRLASDKQECAAQGLSASTSAFEDCVAEANSRRRDAEARQSVRMRELQDQSMENFLHSQSAAP